MNQIFKKAAVACAVAATLGFAGQSAQAITLSNPGNAVLVPYVLYDSAAGVDTAIGITTMGSNTVPDNSTATGALHWYFYNSRSCHEADSMIPATHNDFVGIMWSDLAKVAVTGGCTQAPLNGMKGYMIITGDETPNSLNIFGDAAMIQGAWTATAFIPVMSLVSINFGLYNGYPHTGYVPGAAYYSTNGLDDLDMRYYVAGLGKRTDLVMWMNTNHKANASDADYLVAANVFDENEVGSSNSVKLNDELNVISLTDTASPIGFVTSYKSGFITLNFPADSNVSPSALDSRPLGSSGPFITNAIVAFSLIFTPNGGAQTVLAHERSGSI